MTLTTPSIQCTGMTKKGNICKRRTRDGITCTYHKVIGATRYINPEINEECPVCYDSLADKTFLCGHGMCTGCYTRWVGTARVPTCPTCRAGIPGLPAEQNTRMPMYDETVEIPDTQETHIDENINITNDNDMNDLITQIRNIMNNSVLNPRFVIIF